MSDLKIPIDEMIFSLKHIAGADKLPGWDEESLCELASHHAAFVESEIAPLNTPGDEQGATHEGGRVKLPPGFKQAYQAYAEQGWQGLTVPEAYGGHGLDETGLSDLALGLISESLTQANHAFQMLVGLAPGLVRVLLKFGTEEQKQRVIPAIADGKSLTTMALTEPQAGSDLSAIKTKATLIEDSWRLSGEKIFISNGDQDASETIYHLVLARTSDDGLKGLSLFLCPAHLDDGTRNAVKILRIEHKMGIKAAPTCHMVFDQAQAELIGEPGQGLALMFEMMNHARIDVALQGVGHAARAAQIAGDYACDRKQGGKTLAEIPDVKRMLDEIHMLALGARGVAHITLVEMIKGENPALVELLTPLAKVFCTNAGVKAADLAIQVLGGYGYLHEYQIEQVYRDARIAQIYEGANAIHEAAIVTRHLNKGAGFDAFEKLLAAESHFGQDGQKFRHRREALEKAYNKLALAHAFVTYMGACLNNLVCWKAQAASENSDASSWFEGISNQSLHLESQAQALFTSTLASDANIEKCIKI